MLFLLTSCSDFQVFIDSLPLDSVEWDISEKNQLILYRKDRSVNLVIQTKLVSNDEQIGIYMYHLTASFFWFVGWFYPLSDNTYGRTVHRSRSRGCPHKYS